MNISKFRDLTFIDINNDQIMVIACDSAGAIGNKEMDIVKVEPDIVGYFTAQVALMEILAIGAEPITIVNTLSVEMDNTGKRIIEGIKRATEPLNFPNTEIITGSTEENFPAYQTGIGLTIIGIIEKKSWNPPKTIANTLAVVVGIPKVGNEVIKDKGREVLSIPHLLELKHNPDVYEILPVGSKGILHELKEMARTNGLGFCLDDEMSLDIEKSAGPATCAIISINEKEYNNLKNNFPIPVEKIGRFIEN
ncbi:AIR synthase related protein [Proteiniborus sp.]|uniref:AIR synthase related protein n=1 Tax=Proteiniborus sp. TaxID=2079015 RepID=UPI003325A309